MSLLQVRNVSISCLFTLRNIFPKNSKDTVILFLEELSFSLSKHLLTHLSVKNNGKEFF